MRVTAKTPPADDTTADDCLRWYGLNAKCERTGHVWLRDDKLHVVGPKPLYVEADLEGARYISGRYGRLERRAAWALGMLVKRGLGTVPTVTIDEMNLGPSQEKALAIASSNDVSVITGGPGTGKTTIARVLAAAHSSVLGLSPTGKGADRLSESLGVPCYTIHRAIGQSSMGRLDFAAYDLVCCDETGMLDTPVLEMLCKWLYESGTRARIVFLGDPGQLPSVGPGKVLDELILSLPTTRLDIVYRFSDADIGMACESARAGHLHDARTPIYSLSEGDAETAWREYARLRAIHGNTETRLITYHREDAALINRIARKRVGHNPPVVCTRNNYRQMCFNGQCGYHELSTNSLVFGDKKISPHRIKWAYSYSATCHKSQGGQWGGVVVWIPSARHVSREWLLTACSRAVIHLSVVVRDARVTESCLASSKPSSKRVSLLGAFIKERATWVQ